MATQPIQPTLKKSPHSPLTEEDEQLLFHIGVERERLREEVDTLKARLEQVQKERHQFTIHALAKKFDCKPYHITCALVGNVANG